eukprot:169960-Prymnesium_polylepis.1
MACAAPVRPGGSVRLCFCAPLGVSVARSPEERAPNHQRRRQRIRFCRRRPRRRRRHAWLRVGGGRWGVVRES